MLSLIASLIVAVTPPCDPHPVFPGNPSFVFDHSYSCPDGTSERYAGCILENEQEYINKITLWKSRFDSDIDGCRAQFGPGGATPNPAYLDECVAERMAFYARDVSDLQGTTIAHMEDCCEAQTSMMVIDYDPPCSPIPEEPDLYAWCAWVLECADYCPSGFHHDAACAADIWDDYLNIYIPVAVAEWETSVTQCCQENPNDPDALTACIEKERVRINGKMLSVVHPLIQRAVNACPCIVNE